MEQEVDSLGIDLKHTRVHRQHEKLEGKKWEGGFGEERMIVDWIKHIMCINEY